jgi:hypothetical protein
VSPSATGTYRYWHPLIGQLPPAQLPLGRGTRTTPHSPTSTPNSTAWRSAFQVRPRERRLGNDAPGVILLGGAVGNRMRISGEGQVK